MEVRVGLVALLLAASSYGQGNPLDYEYMPHNDGHYTARARQAGARPQQQYDASIRKCRCGGNSAWDGRGCSQADTYVAVTNLNTYQVTAAPTNAFQVTVGEVQCSQTKEVKVTLDPVKGFSNQFSLLPNGSLYWQGRHYESYCFDHKFDAEGKPDSWEAKVCLPPPVVPRCCHSLSSTSGGSCNPASAQRFSPPIMVSESMVRWPVNVTEKAVKMECNELQNLVTLPLNTVDANLTYESGGVSLIWSPAATRKNILEEEFCVEAEAGGDETYAASVCYEDQIAIHQHLCSSSTCVRKCCPDGEVMYGTDCVPVGTHTEALWVPSFTDATDIESLVDPPDDLTWLYGKPQCDLYMLDPDAIHHDKFLLLNNGQLFRPYLEETYLPTHYCIDNFVSTDQQSHTKALACFPDGSGNVIDTVCGIVGRKVYSALLLVSSVFLGITLVVYISVPEIRDKLHGRCLISLVAALFVAYTLLATIRLTEGELVTPLCLCLASVTHLSTLAAFFWLNVMCFDIWRTLRKTRTVVDGGRAGRRRFVLYSLYAWGCPLIIAVAAVVIDHLPPSHNVLRPDFSSYCWFKDQASHWVYLYGWVMVLVVANVTFFTLVAVILCRAQNNPLLTRSREYNRERMWLYTKLFLVMGVTWVAEVVSWQTGACYASIATDTLNALQGLILFLVFVCRRATWRKVKERCGCTGQNGKSPLTSLTSSLSSFSSSSVFRNRNRNSNISSSVRNSPTIVRSSAAPNARAHNASAAVPLQTLREAPDDSSELPSGGLHETATMISKEDREADRENVTAEETMPLRMTDPTAPSRLLETNLDS